MLLRRKTAVLLPAVDHIKLSHYFDDSPRCGYPRAFAE